MKKLADLYFNYDHKDGEYHVYSIANMSEKDESLINDLMLETKVKVALGNACKGINIKERTDKNVKITHVDVNMSSSISSASMVRFEITLLKAGDESDIMISIISMVSAPNF